ncbi:hypothetical protein BU26DRAFT_570227 [Trematosphaeria pertusa]|uniref:Uncharacterized protein n=1 Tax=Trematosphaeria pertusa TaxID=390896 RepID=A0A6A6HZS6_9PLEO|nr:uncharacterized protein BU26DRAFT_570227 [Trematosphaeria pertusa]KAF2243537.1 hypothetical protein BU26DRAFT_570227 [Trematosphaeria pertusa]
MSEYDFEAFEQQRVPVSQVPTRQQLHTYFSLKSAEAVETTFHDYYRWLDDYRSNMDIQLLLTQDWNRSSEKKMRNALKALPHIPILELGTAKGTRTQLNVHPVFETQYYVPKGAPLEAQFDPNHAYGPVLYTDNPLRMSKNLEKGRNLSHMTVNDSASGLGLNLNKPCNTSTEEEPESAATNLLPAAFSKFTTKLIHLGGVEASYVPDFTNSSVLTLAPYAAIAKISPAGAVEGIFAIPVDGTRNGDLVYVDLDIEAWEPEKRGIYYLGKDLDDCAQREWTLCDEIEVVEVVSYEQDD